MIVLITGTTGIAAATAEEAARRGWSVFTAGLPRFDFTEAEAAEAAVEECVSRHGRIDALFNVAGASGRRHGDGPVHACTEEGWRFTLNANLTTCFHMSRAVLRHMLGREPDAEGRRGTILNMASVLALRPEPEHFATHAYGAAKGGIVALTQSMAAYYAPQGIRVNAIAPGLVRTPMSERAQQDPAILKMLCRKQPLAREMLAPEDVARAAVFLLSDDARHITGQTLTIDAGWSMT